MWWPIHNKSQLVVVVFDVLLNMRAVTYRTDFGLLLGGIVGRMETKL